MISAHQIRAARALLDINQVELAAKSGVGIATVKRVEAGGELRVRVEVLLNIQKALEAAGILFIEQDERFGAGVRLKRKSR